jgi:hypothetical protein
MAGKKTESPTAEMSAGAFGPNKAEVMPADECAPNR